MHISITGRLGSGKSTVAKIFAADYGYEIHSTGSAIRKIAADMGLSALEFNKVMTSDPKYDFMIDEETHRISVERADDKILYDSRMAWHFAENSFKVYLYVATEISAKRILADPTRGAVEQYRDLDDAIAQINDRMMEENKRYRQIYNVDHLDLDNFDLVIDTAHRSCEEVSALMKQEFDLFCADPAAYGKKRYMD